MADSKDSNTNATTEGQSVSSALAAQLMKNPEAFSALQEKLADMVGRSSGYVASLPKSVQRRIKALKKLQAQASGIEAKFYEEIHELECKYQQLYEPLNNKRKDIVTGTVEPTEEECDFPSDDDDEAESEGEALSQEMKVKAKLQVKDIEEASVAGIPGFWLTAFKNVVMLATMIQEHDEPVLEHLIDIKVQLTKDPMGFVLEFHFSPNEYFSDSVLTKAYEMRSQPEEDDPLSFEGPEIVKCTGCKINWHNGKNVTVKLIKKKQKHKNRGTTRMVTKTVPTDSFFNFFAPPSGQENEDDMAEDTEELLQADFEIGHFIRERVVPRAVLYYTGAVVDDEYDEEEEEEDEGESGDEDEDDSHIHDESA